MAQKLVNNPKDALDIRYNIQQYKKQQVEDYINKVVPDKKQFTREDVDVSINKLVYLLRMNNYDPEMIDIMSQKLNNMAHNMNMFANIISADSTWLEVCANRNLLHYFPGTYDEIARKYGIIY